MIVGITHDSDGRAIQRLSVSTKVAIGLPPNGDRNHPTKLDHFVFLKKKKGEEGLEWEPDPELMAHYGDDCHSFHIVLIDNAISRMSSPPPTRGGQPRSEGAGEMATPP